MEVIWYRHIFLRTVAVLCVNSRNPSLLRMATK